MTSAAVTGADLMPAPECDADELVLALLGQTAGRYAGPMGYDWHAAHVASWSVPVACCIRCRREELGCGGLSCRHTTHRQCWPEAFAPNAECRCRARYRCSPWPSSSEDIP